jgi:NAD-dependent SIR2 family protein deacetylase
VADVPDRLTAAQRICVLPGAGISTTARCPAFGTTSPFWRSRRISQARRDLIGTALPRLVARD